MLVISTIHDVAGGMNSTLISFACTTQGCAASVTSVWCDLESEEEIFSGTDMPDCTGFPKHKDVCQHGGRAFLFVYEEESCDMEGKDVGHIAIEMTGIHFTRRHYNLQYE